MSSSPVAPRSVPARASDARPSLTVLSGFWPEAVREVAGTLLARDPALLVVRHEIHDDHVRRTVRSGAGVLEDVRVELVHTCVTCTLREDVLPTVARLAAAHPDRDLVVHLPELAEPEMLADAWPESVRVDSYVTVVDGEHVLDALGTDEDLAALGLAGDDERTLAELVVRQIEYADTLVVHGDADGRVRALLHRLAPWAARAGAGELRRHTHRHRPETPAVLARGLEGFALGVHEPAPENDVVSAVFRARRPFHPGRLHDALDEINESVLRSRGHFWLAGQPETVIAWEFAGGSLGLRSLGRWLTAVPDAEWDLASDQRRLAAAMDWDPYYGDRHHHLVFIGLELDAAALHRRLTGCLLTDAELAEGEAGWRRLPDPMAGAFGTP
ncbi:MULTISPECIES: CobW family GTP-binding protein [Catenuloplanes]|uniref:G3E family GTPase n=1 Tax=Catenuloplanes niger TaxID=587534 RepID=A0AAE4CRG1_9ACTN|nr:GTP-binding protein [Catenuloplanes niger]MDR7320113.1 G3E family GTPase [Catenuloplanes niger]